MKIAFIIAHTRNNVVVLFGTLKVQSFMLTELSASYAIYSTLRIVCVICNIFNSLSNYGLGKKPD